MSEPKKFGIGVSAKIPAVDQPDAIFAFTSRVDTDEIEISLHSDGADQSFHVKKSDFIKALRHIFPDAISELSVQRYVYGNSGHSPQAKFINIMDLFRGMGGDGGFPPTPNQ